MKKTFATILAALVMLGAAAPAMAATAFLQSCNTGTSVTGRIIWVGVYDYAGNRFTRTFEHYCPHSVEVY